MATPSKTPRIPKYSLHKPSGQAVVYIQRKPQYLGRHGSPESWAKYHRLISESMANGGRLPLRSPDLTILEMLDQFWGHAQKYYRLADGSPSHELDNFRSAVRLLKELFGPTSAREFGPRCLRTFQQALIASGLCRSYINHQVNRIRGIFRWAASQELIPGTLCHDLDCVPALKRGRSDARESDPVRTVPEDLVMGIKNHVSEQVWAMVSLQLLTGARAGELVTMRGCEIEMGPKLWIYRPASHKTAHRGLPREIYLVGEAQEIVRQFLKTDTRAFLFSPVDAERKRQAARAMARRTPKSCGNRPGSNVTAKPRRNPRDRYTTNTYNQAVARACTAAFPPPPELARARVKSDQGPNRTRWETSREWRQRLGEKWQQLIDWREAHHWHCHQLRHNSATAIESQHGIEVARIWLGHQSVDTTKLYAEQNRQKVKDIIAQGG